MNYLYVNIHFQQCITPINIFQVEVDVVILFATFANCSASTPGGGCRIVSCHSLQLNQTIWTGCESHVDGQTIFITGTDTIIECYQAAECGYRNIGSAQRNVFSIDGSCPANIHQLNITQCFVSWQYCFGVISCEANLNFCTLGRSKALDVGGLGCVDSMIGIRNAVIFDSETLFGIILYGRNSIVTFFKTFISGCKVADPAGFVYHYIPSQDLGNGIIEFIDCTSDIAITNHPELSLSNGPTEIGDFKCLTAPFTASVNSHQFNIILTFLKLGV